MKKVTLVFLILFGLFVGGIFMLSFLYPSNISDSTNFNLNKPSPIKLTASEVAKHATSDDCYLIIKNKVYNVSTFLDSHPGGRQNIIDNCGQEVTGLFASIHSNVAWNLLGQYYIGDIILK